MFSKQCKFQSTQTDIEGQYTSGRPEVEPMIPKALAEDVATIAVVVEAIVEVVSTAVFSHFSPTLYISSISAPRNQGLRARDPVCIHDELYKSTEILPTDATRSCIS